MSGELGSDLRSEQTSSRAERRPYLENFELDQDSQQGWKNEIKRWKKVHSRNGFFEIYDDKERIEDIRKREREMQGGGYPILVYDEYDTDGNRIRVRLKIDSTPLLDLLRKVITFYPGDDFDILGGKDSPDDSVTFTDPFMIFFDNKTQLEQSLHSDMPEDAKEHARMLLKFIKEEYPFWTFTLAKIQEGRCRKISFSDLWLLFPPNTPVYARKGADIRQIMIYARKSAEYNPQAPLTLTYWEVVCEQGVFKREFNEWTIESFAGEKSINKLDLVPVRYMDNEAELHQKLVARGRRYFELSKAPSLQDYYGTLFPRVYKDVSKASFPRIRSCRLIS